MVMRRRRADSRCGDFANTEKPLRPMLLARSNASSARSMASWLVLALSDRNGDEAPPRRFPLRRLCEYRKAVAPHAFGAFQRFFGAEHGFLAGAGAFRSQW